MPVGFKRILLLRYASIIASTLVLASAIALAQSELDTAHIFPRENPQMPASANLAASPGYMHAIKQNVDLVLVPVSVTDGRQRLVTGLDQSNFQVLEGKKVQEIRHFSNEDAPVSLGVIVDTSGSMKDKMERVREAVTQFCEIANVQDEFFMITFSDEPHVATDFTNTAEDIERELLYLHSKGRTALLDAIYMGIEKMRQARYSKKALLVISDGGDNHSRYGEREVKSAVKESDVMIYAIGTFDRYVSTQEEMLGPGLLANVTQVTGGRAFTLEDPNEMPAVAHRIGTELRTQYVLGYRPEKAPHDGKWHKISIKLKLPAKLSFLRVHAKTGYYAGGE
jgi:Ca-activated chloride channel family protein